MNAPQEEKKSPPNLVPSKKKTPESQEDILGELDKLMGEVHTARPRLKKEEGESKLKNQDLQALLDITQTVNSTLVLDEILQMVMKRAIELLQAERGFLMLLDEERKLQFKTAHNIAKESLTQEDFKISMTIANQVALNGKSIFASDAIHDERFAHQKSIVELNLRSIMCVPLKSKEKVTGIVYVDNSSQANVFVQSDLHLFELFASQAALAVENAQLYQSLLALKIYNENVVNRTPIGIIVVDQNFNITIANQASQDIFKKVGWRQSFPDFTSQTTCLYDLFPEEEKNRWKKICYQVLFTGQTFEEPHSYHQKEAQELVLALKISPLSSPDEQIIGLIILLENVTEKVHLEKQLIGSQKLVAKGEMALSIGHELNNYLTIISNNAELLPLNLKKGDLAKAEHNSKAILECVITMKRFTDSLMDFSKLETEKVNYDIKRLIEDLLFSIKPQKQFARIKFLAHFDSDLPQLYIDVGQIQQVLLNLLKNASEAIAEKPENTGVVYVTTNFLPDQNQVQIKITDTGAGMDKEVLSKLFQPHFTTKKSGHGFGLVTCEKIIKNHGGSITAESQVQKGSTFIISLPVKKKLSD